VRLPPLLTQRLPAPRTKVLARLRRAPLLGGKFCRRLGKICRSFTGYSPNRR
jgi:hypothetical protein